MSGDSFDLPFLFFVIIMGAIMGGVCVSVVTPLITTHQEYNLKMCTANITVTHTDKGYFLPYYIVYSENHSYRVLNENKWIYIQSDRNIGNTVEIKYKSYYDNRGNEIREIVNIKNNWDNDCDNKKSCEKGDD